MKILKKTIALFLVVVLAASAFCLEAFASSRHKQGSYGKYQWAASLYVNPYDAKVSISMDAPTGTAKVRADYSVTYLDNRGNYNTVGNSGYGTRAANCTYWSSYRLVYGRGDCYINGVLVAEFGRIRP